jgi:hypothetical protein
MMSDWFTIERIDENTYVISELDSFSKKEN